MREPTGAPSAVTSRSSSQTVPRRRAARGGRIRHSGRGRDAQPPAQRVVLRHRFYAREVALLPGSHADEVDRPRRAAAPARSIASAALRGQGWSARSTRSAPSSWCASRARPWPTRSAKNATLVIAATAIVKAIASTRSSPARQSRTSIAQRLRHATILPPARRTVGCSVRRGFRRASPGPAWCRTRGSSRTAA